MKTCVSIGCPFILYCKEYNCSQDRSDGCKAQYQLLTLAKQNMNLLDEEIAQKGKLLRT